MSPLAQKKWRRFRRDRRAWWSFVALCALFAFCLCADWVCPCDPQTVVDVKTLEPYCRPGVERTYDVRTVRYSVLDDGTIIDFEGPRDFDEADYEVRRTRRPGYTRVYLEPKEPPKATVRTQPPAEASFPFRPVPGHPFGLDASGRDVFARVVHGLRIALVFGLVLASLGLLVGLVVGAVEGYFGGWTDLLLQRFTEIWSALPFLYVMIFVGATVGRSFGALTACFVAFSWIMAASYVRAEFLRLRVRTFVEAAKVQGVPSLRIVFAHILPNALAPLVTLFPFLLMGAIGSLAALDFLGFGLPPMTPSCGELLSEAQRFRSAWWLVVFPSATLFLAMFLTVLVGEGLRNAFDARLESRLE